MKKLESKMSVGKKGSRIGEVDGLRGLAMIGIMANHIFFPTAPVLVHALQDIPALIFVFLSGLLACAVPATPAKLRQRVIVLFVAGILLGAISGPIAVILTNFSLIIAATPLIKRLIVAMPASMSLAYGIAGVILSTVIQDVLSPLVAHMPLGVNPLYATDPIGFFFAPFVGTLYPVITWVWVYYFGYWTRYHRIEHDGYRGAYAGLGYIMVKVFGVIAYGWPTLLIADPVSARWFSPAPYSAGILDILGGTMAVLALYILFVRRGRWFTKLAVFGRNTFTTYSIHVLATALAYQYTPLAHDIWLAVGFFVLNILMLAVWKPRLFEPILHSKIPRPKW